jgi:hypothetical protein
MLHSLSNFSQRLRNHSTKKSPRMKAQKAKYKTVTYPKLLNANYHLLTPIPANDELIHFFRVYSTCDAWHPF